VYRSTRKVCWEPQLRSLKNTIGKIWVVAKFCWKNSQDFMRNQIPRLPKSDILRKKIKYKWVSHPRWIRRGNAKRLIFIPLVAQTFLSEITFATAVGSTVNLFSFFFSSSEREYGLHSDLRDPIYEEKKNDIVSATVTTTWSSHTS